MPASASDIHATTMLIRQSIAGKTLADYEADIRLRHQVEREFMIVGEALDRLDQLAPALSVHVTDYRGCIGLPNILNHGYPDIDNPTMWRTIEIELPTLSQEIEQLLQEG